MKTASLYIHIPFCISKCKYCDFFSKTTTGIPDEYLKAVSKEIIFYKNKYSIDKLKSIYIGGGTPSLLNELQINSLFTTIKQQFSLTDNCEITIEINPDDVSDEMIENLNNTVINRISCGIQSMNSEVLKYVNRRANTEQNLNAMKIISSKWKRKYSFDLICGLPFESEKTFLKGLKTVLTFKPNHISMYSLTIEEETPLGKDILEEKIKYDYDFADKLWIKSKKYLEKLGFEQYEISNFSKPGFESEHNLVYWSHGDYIGCGAGATGTIYNSNGSGERWSNTRNIPEYIEYWSSSEQNDDVINDKNIAKVSDVENISVEDSIFEFFMMGLRKKDGISDKQFENIFSKKLPEKFLTLFEKWELKKLAEVKVLEDEKYYYLNDKGKLFLNKFLEDLEI